MLVQLIPGIQSISGSFKTAGGKRVVFATRKAHTTSRKPSTRMYIRPDNAYQRKTPVSASEMHAREIFAKRQAYVRNLRASGDKRSLKELWGEAKKEIV